MKKFVVRDYRISLDEKRFQGCGLVTAVLLSDLHGVWHGEGQKALVKAVKDQNPDLILSAGDLITAGGPCDGVYALMEKLAGTYPVLPEMETMRQSCGRKSRNLMRSTKES